MNAKHWPLFLLIAASTFIAACEKQEIATAPKAEPAAVEKAPVPEIIQARLNVLQSISARFIRADGDQVREICWTKSISEDALNSMLSSGVRVITSSPWEEAIDLGEGANSTAACHGTSYIVEGPKALIGHRP